MPPLFENFLDQVIIAITMEVLPLTWGQRSLRFPSVTIYLKFSEVTTARTEHFLCVSRYPFHTSAQYCSQQTVRKASPQMDSERRLDGQPWWTQMPSAILQRVPISCFTRWLWFSLEKGGGEGSWKFTAPLTALHLLPNQHQAAHLLSMQLQQYLPLNQSVLWVHIIQWQRLRPDSGDWTQKAGPHGSF